MGVPFYLTLERACTNMTGTFPFQPFDSTSLLKLLLGTK